MENKKLTKKDYFEMIKGICGDREDIVNFCDHEIELLQKKNSRNVSEKVQATNIAIKDLLIQELAVIGNPITINDLMTQSQAIKDFTYIEGKEEKHLSNQKISAFLNKMVNDTKEVVKVIDKKKALFSLAN